MVSHEFRTPLAIIQSSAELLREFFQRMDPEERDEQLKSITGNTRRMAGMMEEILVLSRLDAGKLEFQPAVLDLNGFCRRLVDEVLSATNRRCLIELSLASVPPLVKADERLLAHIFTNILVIEDEPEMRRNITALLRYKEYEPIAAENGRLGVEVARREKPDLILCDVMMPELDGYGVLRALQADANLALIPFIFLTAKGEKDDLRSGMNLGADDYLAKPVANNDLVQAIEARLSRSARQAMREFKADFSSTEPLLKLGLTPRAAETLLWLSQGKTNPDIATILGITESTVKKHVQAIFEKLGVETRGAATVRALEVLNGS